MAVLCKGKGQVDLAQRAELVSRRVLGLPNTIPSDSQPLPWTWVGFHDTLLSEWKEVTFKAGGPKAMAPLLVSPGTHSGSLRPPNKTFSSPNIAIRRLHVERPQESKAGKL